MRNPVRSDAQVAALVKASEKANERAKLGDAAAILSKEVLEDIAGTGSKSRKRSLAYLRHVAGIYYVTSVDAPSAGDIGLHPLFQGVSMSTISRWSAMDHWAERRALFLEKHRQQLEAHMGSALMAARAEQIKTVAGVTDMALDILEKNKGEFNSWEGVAGVFVRLSALVEDLRSKVAADLPKTEAAVEGLPDIAVESSLTDAEAHAAAALVLQRRREAQEAAEPVAESDAAPALRVVKGDG